MPIPYFVRAATVTENLLKRRWSDVILRHISFGIGTPADLCEQEPDLTIVVMNERLRTMLRYSLIARNPVRASANAATYKITGRGRKLLKLLSLIEQFDEIEDIVIQSTSSGMIALCSPSAVSTDPVTVVATSAETAAPDTTVHKPVTTSTLV